MKNLVKFIIMFCFAQIRGNGLAYSYYFTQSPDSGFLSFYISKANDVLGAYKKTKVSEGGKHVMSIGM